MRILITGGTGFIGSKLIEALFFQGYDDIRLLTRNTIKAKKKIPFPISAYKWNPHDGYIDSTALDGVDVVINLAGEGIADKRWNDNRKEEILNSRIESIKTLMNEIQLKQTPPRKFISTSAIGIYGNRGDEEITESSSLGNDYLAQVCKEWEYPVLNHQIKSMQTAIVRIGIVLGRDGGALSKMLPAFKLGLAGVLGDGNQYMSWIHLDDLIGQFIYLLKNENAEGIYNAVSPTPVPNYVFTKTLGKILNRPTILSVPNFALKIVLGEMSQLLLNGQKVLPKSMQDIGHQFKYVNIEDALKHILKKEIEGEEYLSQYLWVNKVSEEVFSFFLNVKNLERITPEILHFKVLGRNTDLIKMGSEIDCRIKPFGIKIRWRLKIVDFKNEQSFTDIQEFGPFRKWVHTHDFFRCKEGTLVKDYIVYQLPGGFIGRFLAATLAKKILYKVFKYRSNKVQHLLSL